jgi:transcriptional regulator of NAD metabolism
LVFKIDDVKFYLEQEAKTQKEKEEADDFKEVSDVIIEDVADVSDNVLDPNPIKKGEAEELNVEPTKNELVKSKVPMSKEDEMKLGLDLLARFQKPKIPRRRVRLYNPNL